jgi:protein-glutamine gamma-glutamyltransferase
MNTWAASWTSGALLGRLPRESRDTLFLLVVIAWVLLPLVNHVPLWCTVSVSAILLWRGWLARYSRPLPNRWWRTLVLVGAMAGTLLTYRTLLGREPGVALIVMLLALKTMELRARRDAFVVFFMGFFALLVNFLYSQSLVVAFVMLVGLLGLLTALVHAHKPVGEPRLRDAARTALWMTAAGAPVMALLFVLFPRIGPLWGMPGDAMVGRTGLSDNMRVGQVASLAQDDRVAFRVSFDRTPPRSSALYWRGPVLSRFDGRQWRQAPEENLQPPMNLPRGPLLRPLSEPLGYEVTLEPHQQRWLMTLEAGTAVNPIAGRAAWPTPALQWVSDRPVSELLRYRAQSALEHTLEANLGRVERVAYVDLPPGFNPRTLQLAADLRRRPELAQADGMTVAQSVLQILQQGGYTYTLDPGVFGQHTADEFWFDRKSGFCEHIASAFVVLMRAMDVPARVVTGFQGGERNAVDGFWVVRNSDAHAWAEVWVAGRGWVRVDPTAAVSPDRVGLGRRLVAPPGAFAAAMLTVNPDLAQRLRNVWDAVNNRWNQWVLDYSQTRQMDLLRSLGIEQPSWADLGRVLAAALALLAALGACWTLWDRHRQDPWLRLLHQAHARARRAGWVVAPHTPPRQLAAMLAPAGSDSGASSAQRWLLDLEAWRYAPTAGSALSARERRAALATLRRRLAHIAWPSAVHPVGAPQHAA